MSTVLAIWVNQIHAAEIDVVPGAGFTLRYTQEWLRHKNKYPFSPHLPLDQISGGAEVKNFFENLLPEGSALDVAASKHNLSKYDAFGLMAKIGREAAGVMSIIPIDEKPDTQIILRPLPFDEIMKRIRGFCRVKNSKSKFWPGLYSFSHCTHFSCQNIKLVGKRHLF
jgi:serine/threonine-protein kinase HipA